MTPLSTPPLEFGGKNVRFPSEEDLRDYLLACANSFSELTGVPLYEIGQRAMNDPAFIPQIKAGRNFKAGTFERFMVWLDEHWPDARLSRKQKEAG
jgi:hypothetical protein